ncbi:hypothetical protein ACHAQJ_009254 [Trichoderma viride]
MDPETLKNGSSRFSHVTFNDHAGQLWIVTILSLIYSVLVAIARAYIKYQMFGFDDLLLALATVLHLAQSIAVFVGLNSGLGKFNSITPQDQWAKSSKSTLTAITLGLLALSLSKCSVLALILRIIGSKSGKDKPFCIGLIVLSGVWGATRWAVITAMDIFTEILTWFLIVRLSWTVNMSFARKCQVAMVFSFRLPLIALSAIHLAYFGKYPTSSEPQFAVTDGLLFQQTMIVWSLISATVPNMKNFLKSFSMGISFPLTFDNSGDGSGNAYPLQSLENSRHRTTSSVAAVAAGASTSVLVHDHFSSEARDRPHSWRLDQASNQTTAKAHHYGSNSWENLLEEEESSRTGSQEMIIIKEVAWKIAHEDHQSMSSSFL